MVGNKNVKLYIKLEGYNPTGSHKDRPAHWIIKAAIDKGLLGPGKKIISASSGNMASAMAFVAGRYGIPVTMVLANTTSEEKKVALRMLGAELVFVNGNTIKCNEFAAKMAKENDDYVFLDQFTDPNAPRAHYETTGEEIIRDVPDPDILVASLGSGSSLMGIGMRLKDHNPDLKIYAVTAETGTRLPGLRNLEEEHYIPPFVGDLSIFEGIIRVNFEQARQRVFDLAKKEGLFLGFQTGAVVHAALKIAETMEKGKIIVKSGDAGWKNLNWLVKKPEID
ncbi:MAG: cysteine synthase family protein [Deltaproteobacteria bacterium]|nr:cysteine synthase family protein [Deltaproteobacteria bacterium]MBW2130859.1 cysteine synthase family protein [Deltaproteobacteria bacterium]MBW2305228.1 cysteine synthase family protein [Deltaproteobacteria bacterium]